MKKTFILLSLLSLITLMSCTKEGPTGPAGPAGPSGSSVNIAIDSIDVSPSQWISISSGYYKFTHANSAITQEIMKSGTVNVFIKDFTIASNNSSWFAMPNVLSGGPGFRYSYEVNTLTLYADNFSSGVPRSFRYKIVVMK